MIDGKTKVVGIIGNPIDETLSPAMHNAAFKHLNLNWCYLPFLVEEDQVAQAVRAIKGLNLVGLNVTMPFKEAVMEFLDEVEEEAKIVRAVNTIHWQNGILKGYNTDGKGFLLSLKEDAQTEVRGKDVFVLGCGGAARSIAYILAQEKAQSITILNRTKDKAEEFGAILGRNFPSLQVEARSFQDRFDFLLEGADIVVNATPMGKMDLEGMPDLVSKLADKQLVCDLTSSPAISAFLKEVKKRECRVLGGRSMLVFQGALSFKIWTGQDAPLDVMKKAIEDARG